MYSLVYHYTRNRLPSLIASIVYLIAPAFAGHLVLGHLNYAFAYAIAPVLFLSLDKALSTGKFRNIIIFCLFFSGIVLSRKDLAVYYGVFVAFFAVLTVLLPNGHRRGAIVRLVKVASFSGIIMVLFWAIDIYPSLSGASAQGLIRLSSLTVERLTTWSQELFPAILGMWHLRGTGYIGSIPPGTIYFPYLSSAGYYLVAVIPVVFAFSALLFRRDRVTLFFTLSALILVFLVKGTQEPFGGINLWLGANIPLFVVLVPAWWLIVTWLAYAFLIGIAVDGICSKIKGLNLAKSKKLASLWPKVLIPILIILILGPTCLANWFIVSKGLQTWEPSQDEVQAYRWLSEQRGDFRIATVPYYEGYMNIPEGWSRYRLAGDHDLGYESRLFHNKPVVRKGDNNPLATNFVTYTRYLVFDNETKDLMKILGAFDVKYLVMQSYLPYYTPPRQPVTYQHSFFSRQNGLTPIYASGDVVVYENQYWTPRIFSPAKHAMVIGGREALTMLAEIDGFAFRDWGLSFADQVIRQSGEQAFLEMLDKSNAVVFVNSQPQDLALLLLNNAIRIRAVDFAYPSYGGENHWISSGIHWGTPTGNGMFVLNETVLKTWGDNQVSIPISIGESGEYEVWLRIVCGPTQGKLTVALDDEEIASITHYSPQRYMKWVKMGSLEFDEGQHELKLKNTVLRTGAGNDVDEIVLVKPQSFEAAFDKVRRMLQSTDARIISIIAGKQIFEQIPPSDPFSLKGYREDAFGIAFIGQTGPDFGKLKIKVDDYERVVNFETLPRALNPTVLVNNGQTSFWTNDNTAHVNLTDDADVKIKRDSENSLKMRISPGRQVFTLIEKTYAPLKDWSDDQYLVLWFKGEATGATFTFSVSFNDSWDNSAIWYFEDHSTEWKAFVFPKSNPTSVRGDVDWRKVWKIAIGNNDKEVTGTFYIDHLTRSQSIEIEAGIKTIALEQPISFQNTEHMFFEHEGTLDIEVFFLYSLKEGEGIPSVNDLFRLREPKSTTISYEKINPTRYIAHVNTAEPFLLVFSEAYHPLWKAYVDGEEIDSVPSYSFVNSFYLDKTGEFDIVIEFIGQRYANYGGIISLISILGVIAFLILDWKGYSPLRRHKENG